MTTFRTYLKIFLSHRIYIAIYLVMLSLVGVIIGLSTSQAATGEFQPASVNVAVIDRDGSELSSALASHVFAGNNQVDVADEKRAIQDAVARDQVSYLLVVPEGWGEELLDAARHGTQAPNLETYVSYYSGAGRLVDVEATGYADGLYGMAASRCSCPPWGAGPCVTAGWPRPSPPIRATWRCSAPASRSRLSPGRGTLALRLRCLAALRWGARPCRWRLWGQRFSSMRWYPQAWAFSPGSLA